MSQPYDAACDMWSLGVVAYELIALKPPFTARNIKELQQTVLAARYTPPPTSDAAIVRGLVALMLRVYDDQPAQDILDHPPRFIAEIGLDEHLSPTRKNGLASMVSAIMDEARSAL